MDQLDTAGAFDSPPTAGRARAGRSRRRSGENSTDDRAKDDISKADGQPNDFAVELSLLQSVYEQAINAEMRAIAHQLKGGWDRQVPVLTIQLWNVGKCPKCESWIVGRTCPIC